MTVKEVYDIIGSFAPWETAAEFDNVGILIGSGEAKIKKVLVCLDVTEDVAKEAVQIGANLIVSHHPLIFEPLRRIDFDSVPAFLIKNKISLISAHTNLDLSPIGTTALLCDMLGVTVTDSKDFLYVGEFSKEIRGDDFAAKVKRLLKVKNVRYTAKETVKRVAICAGSGSEYVSLAADMGADALVTGDVKHNRFIEAREKGIMIIDAGHYETEKPITSRLAELLRKMLPCKVEVSDEDIRPFIIK